MEERQFANGSLIVLRLMILRGWVGSPGEASTWWQCMGPKKFTCTELHQRKKGAVMKENVVFDVSLVQRRGAIQIHVYLYLTSSSLSLMMFLFANNADHVKKTPLSVSTSRVDGTFGLRVHGKYRPHFRTRRLCEYTKPSSNHRFSIAKTSPGYFAPHKHSSYVKHILTIVSVYKLFAKVASKHILIRHSTVYNIINKFDNNSIDVIIEYVMYAFNSMKLRPPDWLHIDFSVLSGRSTASVKFRASRSSRNYYSFLFTGCSDQLGSCTVDLTGPWRRPTE